MIYEKDRKSYLLVELAQRLAQDGASAEALAEKNKEIQRSWGIPAAYRLGRWYKAKPRVFLFTAVQTTTKPQIRSMLQDWIYLGAHVLGPCHT